MDLLWSFLLVQLAWHPSQAIYHEISAVNFNPPATTTPRANSTSYFGYSFDYQRDIRSLMISAPREDDIGTIYSCNIDTRNCSAIEKDIKRVSSDYDHDYWLGATVRAGANYMVTCAPRYLDYDYVQKTGVEVAHCYKSKKAEKLQRMSQKPYKERKSPLDLLEDKFDSLGWSIDIAKDNSIVIGGPAMYTGRVMKYKGSTPTETDGVQSGIKYNYGYSVAAGYFTNSRSVQYAIGSPFGEDGHGKVVFCDANWIFFKPKLTHELVGTMFGAVLAAARVSGVTSDLLVGAPAYAPEHSHDIGAVYFYVVSKMMRTTGVINPKKVIFGHQEGSQFGSAIVSAGDLNGDGKDEIVIAAPYEDNGAGVGQGAVYLYCGSVFLNEKDSTGTGYLQRIQPRGNYHSFGLSLSALSDYDENGCNELAIGAPDNNTVALYRCMSAVTLDVKAIFPNLQNRENKTFFTFQSCIDVRYPKKLKNITAKIEVTVDIIHQSAALAAPKTDGKYILSLHERKPRYCKDIGVNQPQDGNYDLKIYYKIKTQLLESPINRTVFDVSRVLLSDRSKLTTTGSVWVAECKHKDGCVPNLTLRTSTSKQYIIGSEDHLKLVLSIENSGEVAYDACMIVEVQGASILNANSNTCTHTTQSGQLKCAPRNALHTNSTWESGEIIIDTSRLTNKDKFITVTIKLHDHCMKTEEFKQYNETITLLAVSDRVVISGMTNIGSPVYMTKVDVAETGKQFEQIYTITNKALTNWVDVPCEVTLPKLPYIKYGDNAVTVIVGSSPMYCDRENTTLPKVMFTCLLNSVAKNQDLSVIVLIQILPKILENVLDKEDVPVQSNLVLKFDKETKTHSIITKVELRDISVPWWIILAATILGIIILITIGLILRQCGFMKRKNKEKLKDLRQSVRRQTIRRTMMQQQQEDRRRLTLAHLDTEAIAEATKSEPSTKKRVEIRDSELGVASYGAGCD